MIVDQVKMADSGDSTQSESEPFRPITPIHSPVMLPPCRICSEKASGFHYGANTCEACKVRVEETQHRAKYSLNWLQSVALNIVSFS